MTIYAEEFFHKFKEDKELKAIYYDYEKIEEVRKRLKETTLTRTVIGKLTNLSYSWLNNFVNEKILTTTKDRLDILTLVLDKWEIFLESKKNQEADQI